MLYDILHRLWGSGEKKLSEDFNGADLRNVCTCTEAGMSLVVYWAPRFPAYALPHTHTPTLAPPHTHPTNIHPHTHTPTHTLHSFTILSINHACLLCPHMYTLTLKHTHTHMQTHTHMHTHKIVRWLSRWTVYMWCHPLYNFLCHIYYPI